MSHSALSGTTSCRAHFYQKNSLVLYGVVLFIWALVTCSFPALARAERRMALVIGNATYGNLNVLRNPVHDATDIATALRQLGFEVTLLRDVDRRVMIEAIDTFSLQLRHGGAGLFYYAGHGVQVQGENYLIPLQARISREQDIPYEAVPVGRILGGMEDARNQLNLLILDACRDNPYARQWRSTQRGLAALQAVQGSLIAYATAPGAVALDGDGRNGVYTSHLLKHLSTSGLSVEQLFKHVRTGVVEATRGKQTPWESSSLIGDFFFAPQIFVNPPVTSVPSASPVSPAASSGGAPGPDPEVEMWTFVKDSSHAEDLAAFLNAYPKSRFAPAAQIKLQQLQRLDTQRRTEHEKQLGEQERQRQERAVLEAQQRAEAQRLETQKRQKEEEQQVAQNPLPQPAPQVARVEPDSALRRRESIAVPAAVISEMNGSLSTSVPAFRMDVKPVSNRDFLAFVQSQAQWKRSQITKSLHDGDYLKHWDNDGTIKLSDIDEPVRYVSYYAAAAYCEALGKKLPRLAHYRSAANVSERPGGRGVVASVSHSQSYKPPDLHFLRIEWTDSWWGDPGLMKISHP